MKTEETPLANNPIFAQSSFGSDIENWKVLVGYPEHTETVLPVWKEFLTDFSIGFIVYNSSQATATTNCFFSAPSAFTGNLEGTYGYPLSFELAIRRIAGSETENFYIETQEVIISGADDALFFNAAVADTYQHPELGPVQIIKIILSETSSGCVLKSTGAAPTQQQFKDVLNNVQALLIRADYFENATQWVSALGMVTLYGNALDPKLRELQQRLQYAYDHNPDQELILDATQLGNEGNGIITLFQQQLGMDSITLGDTVTIVPDTAQKKLVVSGTSQNTLLGLEVAPVVATFGISNNVLDIAMGISATEGWTFNDSFPLLTNTFLNKVAFSDEVLPIFTLTGPQTNDGVAHPLQLQAKAAPTGILAPVTQLVTGVPDGMLFQGPVYVSTLNNTLSIAYTLPSFTLSLSGIKPIDFTNPAFVIYGLGLGEAGSEQLESAFRVQSEVTVGGVTLPLAVQLPAGLYGWTFMTIPGSVVPVGNVPEFIIALLPGSIGTQLNGLIPQKVKDLLNKFAITNFMVNMKTDRVSFNSLNLTIESNTGESALWPILPGIVELAQVGFSVTVNKSGEDTQTTGSLWGSMTLSETLTLSAQILLPVGTGNWTLGAATTQPFALTDVAKLLGGTQLAALLPDSLAAVTGLMLNNLSLSYNPSSNTLTNFKIDIGTVAAWNIVPERQVSVKQFGFMLSVINPLDSNTRKLTGRVGGTLSIGSMDIKVTVQKPTPTSDWSLTVLSDDITLPSLGELTTIMGGTEVATLIPETIRNNHFKLRTIALGANVSQQKLDTFNFELYSPDKWVIIDNDILSITEPSLFLYADWTSGSLITTGGVSATLTFIGSDFLVSAEKKADPNTWLLSCTLDDDTPLNLTQAVQKYISGATLPNGFPDIVLAEASITYDTASSAYHFNGLVNLQNPDSNKPWSFDIGTTGIAIKGIGLDVKGERNSEGVMPSPTVTVTGGLKIGSNVSFDISYVVGGDLKISGVLIDGQTQVYLKDLVANLCNEDASHVTWTSSFKALDDIYFTNVYLDFTIGDKPQFTVGGTMLVNDAEVNVLFVLQKNQQKWEFAFGIKISMDTDWSIPGFTDTLSTFSINQATFALVASSFTDNFTLPPSFTLPQVKTVERGLGFYAIFNFSAKDSKLDALKQVLPTDMSKGDLYVHGQIVSPVADSYVEVVLSTDQNGVPLMGWDDVRLKMFSLRLYAKPAVALHGEFLMMMIKDAQDQPLKLVLELYASATAVGIRFIPNMPFHDRPVIIAWVNALGINGLTFFLTDLDLSIIPEGPSLKGTVGGGVDFQTTESNSMRDQMVLDHVLIEAVKTKRKSIMTLAATSKSTTFCDFPEAFNPAQPIDSEIRVEGKVGFLVVPESPEPVLPYLIGVKLVNFTLPYMLKRFAHIELPSIMFPILFPEVCFLVSLDPTQFSNLLHFEFNGQIIIFGFHGNLQALCTQERIMFAADMDPIHFSVNGTNIVTIQRSSTEPTLGPKVYVDTAPVAPLPNIYASIYCNFFDELSFEGQIFLVVNQQNPADSYFKFMVQGHIGQLADFKANLAYEKAQYMLIDASFQLLLDTEVNGFSLQKDGQQIKVADKIKLKGTGIYLAAQLYMQLNNRGTSPDFTFYASGSFEIKQGNNCDVTLHLELGTEQHPLQVGADTFSTLPSAIFTSMSHNAASIFSAMFQTAECFANYLKIGLVVLHEGAEVALVFAKYFITGIEIGAKFLSELGHAVQDVSDWLWDVFNSRDTHKNTQALRNTNRYDDDKVAEAIKTTATNGGETYTAQQLISDQHFAGYNGVQATAALVRVFAQPYGSKPVDAGKLVATKYSADQVAAGLRQSFASQTVKATDMFTLLSQIYTGAGTLSAQQMANALAPLYPASEVAKVLYNQYHADADTAAKMADLLLNAYLACGQPLTAPSLAAALAQFFKAADVAKVLKSKFPDDTGTPPGMASVLQTAYTAAGHPLDAPAMTAALASAPFTPVETAPEIYSRYPSDAGNAQQMAQLLFNAFISLQNDPADMLAALAAVAHYPTEDIVTAIKNIYHVQFQQASQMAAFLAQQNYPVPQTAQILRSLYASDTVSPAEMALLLQNAYGSEHILVDQMAAAFAAAAYTAKASAPELKNLYPTQVPDAEAMAVLLLAAFVQPPLDAYTLAVALAATPYAAAQTADTLLTHFSTSVPDAASMARVLQQAPYDATDVAPILRLKYPTETATPQQMASILAGVNYTAVQIARPLKNLFAEQLAQASAMAEILMANYSLIDLNTMAQALAAAPYLPQEAAPVLHQNYTSQLTTAAQMADLLIQTYGNDMLNAHVMALALGASTYIPTEVAILLRSRYAADTNTALKLGGLLYNAYQNPLLEIGQMLGALAAGSFNAWENGPVMHQYYVSVAPTDLALALVQTYSESGPLGAVTLGIALVSAQVAQESLAGAIHAGLPGTPIGVMAVALLLSESSPDALNTALTQKHDGKTIAEAASAIMQAYPNTNIPVLCSVLMSIYTPPNASASDLSKAVCGSITQLDPNEVAKGIMAMFPDSTPSALVHTLQAGWAVQQKTLTAEEAANGIVTGFKYLTLDVTQTDVANALVSTINGIVATDIAKALVSAFESDATINTVLVALRASMTSLVPIAAATALTSAFNIKTDQLQILANELSKQFKLTLAPNTVASMALALKASDFKLEDVSAVLKNVYSPNWKPADYSIVLDVFKSPIWNSVIDALKQGKTVTDTAVGLKAQYNSTSANLMCSVLASAYYLIATAPSVIPMARAMKAAGYLLPDTAGAMKLQYQPDWTPQNYMEVLKVYQNG